MTYLRCAIAAMAVLAAGCGESTATLPPAPDVSPATITDTFTGTVPVMGSNSHNFIVGTAGKLTVTLTDLGEPGNNLSVGLGIGVPSGVTCALTLGEKASVTTQASSTPQISGTAIPGTFCVVVYDVGNLTDPVDYSVSVAHS